MIPVRLEITQLPGGEWLATSPDVQGLVVEWTSRSGCIRLARKIAVELGGPRRTCAMCGKIFVPRSSMQKTCGTKCSQKNKRSLVTKRNRQRPNYTGPRNPKCIVCGDKIPANRLNQRRNTCCHPCNRVKRNIAASVSKQRSYESPEVRRAAIRKSLARYYDHRQRWARSIGEQIAIIERELTK